MKSTSGYFLSFCGGPVLWGAHKQKVLAMSIAEAEYMSLSRLGRDIIYAKQLVTEMGFPVESVIPVHEDCKPAINIAENPGFSNRSKSIRLAYHNVRDLVADGVIKLIHISGDSQPADILTKPLSGPQTASCCRILFSK